MSPTATNERPLPSAQGEFHHSRHSAVGRPILRSLAPDLARYDGATELERGLDILLSGLSAAT